MTEIRNPFVYSSAAQRYSRSRPEFHPIVMERIRAQLNLLERVSLAVDVGCGTGQSARALTLLARKVIATDISPQMLAEAEPDPQVQYLHAPAEDLPLERASADLMTASVAFHWFDQAQFLTQAARVLNPGGHLVIYGNYFTRHMLENPLFFEHGWPTHQRYPNVLPHAPQQGESTAAEVSNQFGLEHLASEQYSNEVRFTLEELVAYLLTQSNFIAPLERGETTVEELTRQLEDELRAYFLSGWATFGFEGPIDYFRRV